MENSDQNPHVEEMYLSESEELALNSAWEEMETEMTDEEREASAMSDEAMKSLRSPN